MQYILRDSEAPCADKVFNYSVAVLKLCLLHRNFADSVKEGDGEKTCMLWKFFTLHFHAYKHHKYALEGLILSACLGFTLSQ